MTHKISWWSRASSEQKLAQIDGGIELGMSSRQIALNVGATRAAVLEFGRRAGRQFVAKASTAQMQNAGRIAGLNGARRSGKADFEISSAFSIFGETTARTSFLDEVPA